MNKPWPVQDAKARFSELLRAAEKEPQIITYRGEPKFEIRSMGTESETGTSAKGLPRWWENAPRVNLKLPPRKRERMRKIDL
jgi:prevent-host-death family protein